MSAVTTHGLPPTCATHRHPILLDNDANVVVLSERRGQRDRFDDMLLIKPSTSLGPGVVTGGTLQRGAVARGNCGAQDCGRAVACGCGDTGCLEAIAEGRPGTRMQQQDESGGART